jgi:hypothetical protein
MARALLSGLIFLVMTFAAHGENAIDPKTWLTPDAPVGDTSFPVQKISGIVVPVRARNEAISLLMESQIVELTAEQSQHLLGLDRSSVLGASGAAPYLVRAVSPNDAGECDASLRDDILFVFCGSLGDWNYELSPVVVFLHRKPSAIRISAMTAR